MPRVISIDFETFYSKKLRYSLKSSIAEQYCNNPLFDAYMVSVSDGKQCWAGHPRDFTWSALEGATLLSHNKYFDSSVHKRLVQLGVAPETVDYSKW